MRFLMVPVAALVAGCTNAAAPRLGDEFTLRVGQSASITELNLWMRFIKTVDDSRCPADALCVWEGDGAVLLEVAPLNGDSKEDTVHTSLDPHTIPLGHAELRLVHLQPYPLTSKPIAPGDYVVTLVARSVP
jgi:hypothetical protein